MIKKDFISPEQLLISKDEFFDIVATKLKESLNEFNSEAVEERSSYIKTWININVDLIKDEYLTELKNIFEIDYRWKTVKVEKQFNERGGNKIFIYLSLK